MQIIGRKAQIHDAKLGKNDGCRAQISSEGCKWHCEIHPRCLITIFTQGDAKALENFQLKKT
jgi:hypothetical protein